ncbi:hypothetical protein ACYCVF_36570 [Bradyrhizobium sp. 1.29L]
MNLTDQSLLQTKACVAGGWQAAEDESTFDGDPSNGRMRPECPHTGALETRRSISAANGV